MSDQLRIELTPEAQQILKDLQTLPQHMVEAIARVMKQENDLTVSHIQRKYMSFPKSGPSVAIGLRFQSGRLRQDLWTSDPAISGQAVQSAIGDIMPYARIHEFGGTIPAHKVTPKKGKALRFAIGDRIVFAKSANIPAIEIPARAPIQHGIEDRLDIYGESISDAIQKAWEKGGKPS